MKKVRNFLIELILKTYLQVLFLFGAYFGRIRWIDKQVKLCYVYSMKNNTVVNVSKFAEQFRIYTHDSWGHVWVRHIEDHSITAMSRWNSIAPVPGQVNGSYQDAINEATGSILDQLYA